MMTRQNSHRMRILKGTLPDDDVAGIGEIIWEAIVCSPTILMIWNAH